ncbi:MAG TPA: DegT/DnrJ/EryC1/StrS family aminotransferase [Candidatus Dormibacteraeota bacterium]|nr:DegT/DnrJ/EryC1/StrS family aminotransferase [Candidatus Dormibacteraeota bacterium]
MLSDPEAPSTAGHIPLCAAEIGQDDVASVVQTLQEGWVSTAGPAVGRFEGKLAEYVGARHVVATNSGTAALHVSLLVAGIQADDEVLVSDMTFIAPVNAIRYVGARPVLVDAEPDHWQMDAGLVAGFLERQCAPRNGHLVNRKTGRRVSAVLPVHLLGHPCDIDALRALTERFGLALVEDSTESLGALYKDRKVGGGGLSSLSFNGNKLITTGAGGAIVTDDDSVAARAMYLVTQAKDDPLEYVHHTIGFNYRMPSLNAALGIAQLARIERHLEAKREIARRYASGLQGVPGVEPMSAAPWARAAWWLYTVRIDRGRFGRGSRELMRLLAREGIDTRPIFQPMHQSKAHAGAQAIGGKVAERIVAESLSLPSSVGLTEEEQERVIATIKEFGPN